MPHDPLLDAEEAMGSSPERAPSDPISLGAALSRLPIHRAIRGPNRVESASNGMLPSLRPRSAV